MNFIIRKANKEDALMANKLLTKLIIDERQYDKNINEDFIVTSFYENFIDNSEKCLLVAIYDDKIVGYLYGFILIKDETTVNKTSQLDALFVEEEYRGNNIANELIKEFKKWSKDKNVKYIEVSACSKNNKAINLYHKNGFEDIKLTMNIEL